MPATTNQRYLALDVFRGITICFMIIVNTSGGSPTFAPLEHAKWNGFTPTDLVFPSFVFVVGNAMSFVMAKWSTLKTSEVLMKIFKRTFIIFLLGYLMYWFPFVKADDAGNVIAAPFSGTRVFGVLQRIALVYGISSLMIYFWGIRTTLIITIIILIIYWPVMMYFGDGTDPLSLQTNAVLKLDTWLFGPDHLYHGERVDGTPFAFDPEGFLSTFPAIGNCVAGYVVGKFVQQKGKTYEGLTKILLYGFLLLVVAHFWNYLFPINKKLWTSSFVLHTTALDCMLIALVIYLIDFANKTRWTRFFQVFGKNPLPIYLFSELFVIVLLIIPVGDTSLFAWSYQNIFQEILPDYFSALAFAICYMLICWSVGYFLDKKKIYIKV